MTSLKLSSRLPDDLESLVHVTIGCCIAVHRELGPGLLERVYPRAIALELGDRHIPYSTEKVIPIRYKNLIICHHRIDLMIDNRLVREVKSVERLGPIHVAQVINYLRVTGARVGLLVNFNVPILKQGIRRVVL